MNFKEIRPDEWTKNPFTTIGDEWMLVTAEKDGKVNTMTASWGGVGIMWNKKVAFLVIRPQRYTKEFIDSGATLSLSFLNDSYRKTLAYLGSVSGRDEDKITKAELTLAHDGKTPYFAEANTVMICRKLFAQEYTAESFVDQSIIAAQYPAGDYHTMYIVEIEKILTTAH